MNPVHEAELEMALERGILSPAEVPPLREEARRLKRSPLELLRERGLISDETLAGIRGALPRAPALESGKSSDGARTLNPDSARNDGATDEGGFPVLGWDRFQFEKLLGRGGMGQVFLAYDPRLHRKIALKFVRGHDNELIRRLVSEARAQARVKHERVCEVYEVGEIQNLPYIAMQYVEGQPLGQFIHRLGVEQKVQLLRDAAQGVHAAHHAGLIHRDLKPSNILVELAADGGLRPFVMDFGLARDWSEKGVTATGSVLGTPHYMSPEQARGEGERLDWRTDVYSLGATLYHLLTGQVPIVGENTLKVLNDIPTVEPRRPSALNPKIPRDLDAIVLKCLEKERTARYDSVLALIEDLDRFLAHEPVKARPIGLGYRLRKKARKHRVLVNFSAGALLLLTLTLGWAAYTASQASRREQLARSFTEMVEHIEAQARFSALAPVHDTRQDLERLRAQLDALKAEVRDAGALAEGAGRHALGRGHLALQEEEKAREQLEAAWQAGYREPKVASALAVVLGRMYRDQLLEAARRKEEQRGGGPEAPGPDPRQLKSLYLQPALEYLRLGQGESELFPNYVTALIAFSEERFEDALTLLREPEGALPWIHEARQLRGDIFRLRASRRMSAGDFAGARADFAAGREAYTAAAEIGRSVLALHLAQGELELAWLTLELHSSGDLGDRLERGLEVTRRARLIAPDSAEAPLLEARLYRRAAEYKVNQQADAKVLLQKALEAAQEALRLEPSSPVARIELARCLVLQGRSLTQQGQDPRRELLQALMHFEQIDPKHQSAEFEVYVGLLFENAYRYEDRTGADPAPYLERAIEAYRKATVRNGALRPAWLNLGRLYLARARRKGCAEQQGDLAQARAALDKARALSPEFALTWLYLGHLHMQEATRRRACGGDSRSELLVGREQYQRGLALNPRSHHHLEHLGFVQLELAREEWMLGRDPFPLLEQARATYEQVFALAPDFHSARNHVSEVFVQRALYQRARGESPEESLRAALVQLTQVLQPLEKRASLWTNLGTVHVLLADFELEQGRDPRPSLARAEEALGTALKINPSDAQPWLYRGQLQGLQARWNARQGRGQSEDFERAVKDFQKGLELAADPLEFRLAFGRFCREWAAWQRTAGGSLERPLKHGLEQAEAVLASRPELPDALLLRASLLLLQAEATSLPTERARWRERASMDLTRALALSPHFERPWRERLQRLQR
jgi:tetratricopeptide (TPR) repeat protein/predicted Ser/Thr protein kinase